MDIFSDIAAVNRRIAELTGSPLAAPAPQTVAQGAPAQGSFSSMVSDALSAGSPNVIPPPQVDALITSNAGKYGVDPALVKAIVANESAFNPSATSPTGAQGLMQLEPETAASLGVDNAYDPAQNISGGTRYIRGLLERFNGDVRLAVAAYNAGPGAVEKYGGVPPYAETQNYVRNVLDDYQKYRTQ